MHAVPKAPTLEEMARVGVVNGTHFLGMWLNRNPGLTVTADVVCHIKVRSDDELREVLEETNEYWDFEPGPAVLTRSMAATGGAVRVEIDVAEIALADVLAILDETRPPF